MICYLIHTPAQRRAVMHQKAGCQPPSNWKEEVVNQKTIEATMGKLSFFLPSVYWLFN